MTGSEDYHLEQFCCSLQTIDGIGSKVDASSCHLAVWEAHLDELVDWVVVDVFDAMNQCFIQVKDDSLCNPRLSEGREGNHLAPDLIDCRRSEVVLDVLERLQRLNEMHFVGV